jgi:hypothetical protein
MKSPLDLAFEHSWRFDALSTKFSQSGFSA